MYITVQNLTVALENADRPDKIVLHDITVEFPEQKVTYLIGPNGAGKSALLHTIMGNPLFKVQKGQILVHLSTTANTANTSKLPRQKRAHTIDITNMPAQERAKLGLFLTWQEPIAIPGLTVFSYFYNLYKYNFDKNASKQQVQEQVLKILKQVKLPENALHKEINLEFSGGEKKKLEVATILWLKPKFIMLDELDSGLDIQSEKHLFTLIKNYAQKSRATLVIVSHSFRVRRIIPAQRVVVLKNGRVAATGGPELIEKVEAAGYKDL